MCVCAIAIGVYSAKIASLNISGTIGFTAHNCKVRVLDKITGVVNTTSDQSDLTNNTSVTDVVAYYNSTDNKVIVYSPARIYAPQNCSSIFFGSEEALTRLNLRNFNTSKVTNMSNMFNNCSKLTTINVSNGKWVISSSENTTNMFNGCGCSAVTFIQF